MLLALQEKSAVCDQCKVNELIGLQIYEILRVHILIIQCFFDLDRLDKVT